VRILATPKNQQEQAPADELTAELSAFYWRAYDQRLAEIGFFSIARQLPGLIGQAVRLGWEASRRDTAATIGLNVVSGVLSERIAVIAQDHANWPLTVRHNIAMGRDEDPARLARAAAASGADTVIGKLPHGYDTLLDRHFKDGAEVSGGQWQRIAAARGFYRSAPLLIMDEPTAALDARAEYALFSSIRGHAQDRGVVLITHRLASVRHADRIYALRDGRVIEQGGHAELLALGGQYAELFTLQASQYES
jgi:ABC-type transport system involved in cytochrome bd biosynthesis fused ATPase/permease subunit